jgi:hypothetical protein
MQQSIKRLPDYFITINGHASVYVSVDTRGAASQGDSATDGHPMPDVAAGIAR